MNEESICLQKKLSENLDLLAAKKMISDDFKVPLGNEDDEEIEGFCGDLSSIVIKAENMDDDDNIGRD
jgi:hypothetical protein